MTRTPSDHLLVAEALAALVAAKIAVGLLPFRVTQRLYRLRVGAGEPSGGPAATRLGWAVRAAARRTPWTSTCLMQSLAAARLLHRRRLDCVLYLGVAKTSDGYDAHSWLTSGDEVLTGAGERERFTPVARYVLPPA